MSPAVAGRFTIARFETRLIIDLFFILQSFNFD
jgi:hypothetical protein